MLWLVFEIMCLWVFIVGIGAIWEAMDNADCESEWRVINSRPNTALAKMSARLDAALKARA